MDPPATAIDSDDNGYEDPSSANNNLSKVMRVLKDIQAGKWTSENTKGHDRNEEARAIGV